MAKKAAAGVKPLTKSQLFTAISENTGLSKKDTSAVFDALGTQISSSLGKRGAGVIQIPGLVKIERKKKPAQPAKKGVRNPFTGELYDRPAKPASVTVKVRALKNLKDMV